MWLSIIWNSSCGDGMRPVSSFDHTGMSLIDISNAPEEMSCGRAKQILELAFNTREMIFCRSE